MHFLYGAGMQAICMPAPPVPGRPCTGGQDDTYEDGGADAAGAYGDNGFGPVFDRNRLGVSVRRIVSVMISKAEQARRSRRALLDAARESFAARGYAETLTGEIVRRIGATRGTLYYHFRDKAALFETVYQEQRVALAQAIGERIQTAEGASQQQLMLTVCHAFIEQAADPSVRRILFVDGPAVLGWNATREPDPALLLLRQVFASLMAEGVINPRSLDLFLRLVWAMCFEAGLYIAHAADSATARQEMVGTLERLLTGLKLLDD